MKLLDSARVEYLLIGGYAVGYHGYPRATADMDVWVAVSTENAGRLSHALRAFGFSSENVPPTLFLEEGNVLRMGVPPLRLEIVTGISGVTFEDCYSRRVIAEIDDVAVSIISLADLKANKRASGRHKDLDDLEHLP